MRVFSQGDCSIEDQLWAGEYAVICMCIMYNITRGNMQ